MRRLILALLAITLLAHISSAGTVQHPTLASAVEKAILDAEPDWKLAEKQTVSNHPRDGAFNPDLEEASVTLTWKQKDSEAVVYAYKLKELEKARHLFTVSTITPVMRSGYELTKEGVELKRLVHCPRELFNCAGFFTNRRVNGHIESYDAVFIMDRAVIIVRTSEPEVAQRFALHIARALQTE